MKDCNCKDEACFCNISEDENQYIIDRLEDIIEISEFLLKTLKHRQEKEAVLKELEKREESISSTDIQRQILEDLLKNRTNTTRMKYPYYWGHIWY